MKCNDCAHVEMCKWINEVGGNGCDFEDIKNTIWNLNAGEISFKTNNKALTKIAYSASFWNVRHDILLKLAELKDNHVKSLTIQEIEDLIMNIPCKGDDFGE